jgi:hypothetical protein
VADSVLQQLIVVPLGRGGALPPESSAVPMALTGDIRYGPGFNANGIVAARGGRFLVIVQSSTAELFRVDAATGVTRQIDLRGTLTGGDGLELRGRTLYVVRGMPNAVSVVRLGPRLLSGRVVDVLTSPGNLDVPSTATIAAGRLWVVNARFGVPITPRTPYWLTQLPLRSRGDD